MLAATATRSTAHPAVDRVVAGLTNMVIGELTPGAQLPSESELAVTYAVSRLTVREAVKVLAGRGLLELARGRRAVVREPDGSAFGDFLSAMMKHDPKGLFDLIEVRQALEIHSAQLSAKRKNRAGLAAIEAALQGMRETAADHRNWDSATEDRFHEYDVGFHEAMALSSGNRMLAYLLEAMAAPLRESFHLSMQGHKLRGYTPEATIAAHERIFERVKAGDGRGAAQAMRLHLRESERDIRAAQNARLNGKATLAPRIPA
jgi:GntR family transcriptional repressor for pyruvate dehydrogenase complex